MSSKDRRIDLDACLDDILQSADAVDRYITGISADQFAEDEMRQDAVVRRLEVIGEAADRMIKADPQYEMTFPSLPLAEAKRMRNFVIHGYDQVNVKVVWETAKNDIPDLRNRVMSIVAQRQAAPDEKQNK